MNKSPRILQLLPALGEGGVERSAVEMARYLSARGVSNWIASAPGPLVAEAVAAGAVHVPISVGRKSPIAMIRNAIAIARLVDREQIDIVHALSRAPAWVAWLACRQLARRPCHFVSTVHGAHGHRNALKRFYNGGMLRAEVVVASSQFVADHLQRIYALPPEKIITATRGIDPQTFDPARFTTEDRNAVRQALGAHGDTPLLVMVGRVTSLKGHAVLVEALAKVADLPWRAAFVGSGNTSVIAAAQARIEALGLKDRIVWTGSRSDIPAILAASDLAFSASIRPEAFGLVSVEAQAMETPVIATDHGGSRETVLPGETGWLVEPGSADALAAAIRQALADPERLAAMGQNGRHHVLANFTRQTMLDREYAAYERVLGLKA